MTTISHDDELTYAGTGGGSNRHRAFLHLEKDGVFHPFDGKSLPGVCRVVGDNYKKNGKWSYTAWTLQLADGVVAWTNRGGALRDLSGLVPERASYVNAKTWADVPAPLVRVLRALCPNASARLDEADKPV